MGVVVDTVPVGLITNLLLKRFPQAPHLQFARRPVLGCAKRSGYI